MISGHDSAERERHLRASLNAAGFYEWTYDCDCHLLDLPRSLQRLLGLTEERTAPLGTLKRRLKLEDRVPAVLAFRAASQGRGDLDVRLRILQPRGLPRHLHVQGTLVKGANGRVLRGLIEDIDARKREDQWSRDNDVRIKLAMSAARTGTWRWDLRSREIIVDGRFRALFGFGENETVTLATWNDKVDPEDREMTGHDWFREHRARRFHDAQYRILTADGRQKWIESVGIVIYDSDRQARYACGTVTDITEQKGEEQERCTREQEFRTLIENSPDIISRVDREGRYLYINRAVESVFRISRSRFIGRTVRDLRLPAEAANAVSSTIGAALESGAEGSASFDVQTQDGVCHFMARAIPEADASGAVGSVLSIITDVTERSRAQIERDQLLEREYEARKQAEAAARARDQFLAIVSHELRSPLNGIQNWSYVLENHLADPAPAVKRAIAGIRSGIEQQVRLIDDLLDATRIMGGKLSLALQPTALLPIVRAAIDSVCAAAGAKRIEIEATCELESDTIIGDADRLQQIFWNLLSNAVKFTPQGGHIWVTSAMEQDTVVIHIRDDGKGIAPEFLPYMFEWFRRDQTDRSRAQDGLGLGLALVRHLCDLHGGRVTARSEGVGKGATFSVRMPLKVRATTSQSEPQWLSWHAPAMALAGLRVLIVDDQRESLESLATLLQHAGAQTAMMLSGEGAREWLQHCDAKESPHVLLCDIAMPGEDGYTTLRKVREYEAARGIPQASRIPAIAISASAQREDRIRALASGFQMYITKPSSIEELIVALATVTGRQLSQSALNGAAG